MPWKRNTRKKVFRKRPTTKRFFPKKKFGKKFSKKRVTFGGIPDSKFCKLKYVDYAPSATAGGGAVTGDIRYRLNSPYDPNYTTGSGQLSAQMFQIWSQFYGQYIVYSCKVIQECWNYDDVTPMNFHSFMSNTLPSWSVGSDRRVLEMNRWVQTKTASPNGSGRNMVRFKRYIKLRTLAGVTKSQFQGGLFSSVWNSNPTDQMFTQVLADPLDPTDVGSKYQIKTTIIFYTKFFDRNPITTIAATDTAADLNDIDVPTEVEDNNDNKVVPP